jgi:bifunctional UDP-N-acetylglucosamine pyrophosphorylase/glucosamine-1-phosphate N-acetyltransferase
MKLGVFMGDGVKTGINTLIMPGVKIGSNSWIGPNIVLTKDTSSNTLLLLKQHMIEQKRVENHNCGPNDQNK